MEIAIVDDLEAERKSVRDLVLEYFKTHSTLYNITPSFFEFESGEAFLNTYQPGNYQLVFLDIYMNKLTGIDVAHRINSLDKKSNIIFFTTSEEHMLDGYDVHAVGYLLKPVTEHTISFHKAMDRVMEKLNLDNSSIFVETGFGKHSIFHRNIIYLECSTRSLFIHMGIDTFRLVGKYADYSQMLLCDKRFLECYRNIIVNMDYIDVALETDFILKSGERIPISRRKKSEVMEKYMAYFIEKRGV